MLPYADRIIALNKGVIVNDGPYQKILADIPEMTTKFMISNNEQPVLSEDRISEVDNDSIEMHTTEISINNPEEALIIKEQDLLRRNGSWDVYKYYVKSAGYKTTALFIFSLLITGFFSNFASEFYLFFFLGGYRKFLLMITSSSLASMVVRCERDSTKWKAGILSRSLCNNICA